MEVLNSINGWNGAEGSDKVVLVVIEELLDVDGA